MQYFDGSYVKAHTSADLKPNDPFKLWKIQEGNGIQDLRHVTETTDVRVDTSLYFKRAVKVPRDKQSQVMEAIDKLKSFLSN